MLEVQCSAFEYAGCIWIVVVIVVPTVTAIADSNNIEKTRIFFISIYEDTRYLCLHNHHYANYLLKSGASSAF
jgi:hypothetical protein